MHSPPRTPDVWPNPDSLVKPESHYNRFRTQYDQKILLLSIQLPMMHLSMFEGLKGRPGSVDRLKIFLHRDHEPPG